MALWLVKDNAVNVELGFLEHPYRDPIRISVSSNSRAIRFSDAADEFPVYEFLEQELRDARDIYVALFEKNALQIDLALSTRTVSPESTRFDRVLYFAQGARGASDLGMKVATYVTCFESLFSTETSELAHKLAERVAFFCGDTPATRFEVFKTVKVAYTIRSRTVHGDKLPAKLAAQAKPTAQQCDALLRSALNKILTAPGMYEVFVGSPDKLENYLTRLVFGVGDGCLGA